ncbi:MAG: NAD(P)/FAD-dependent oxidoreductase [Nevskia sp.]|nr:NAD(P)/FAD-dependent oxidoreductase [Nevskia sp.]
MAQMQSPTRQVDAVVVGAGFSGLYGVYRLRQQGLEVQAFEQGGGVGGTWYWNRYPGARVDSQSYIYQYWFCDKLLNDWDWSERFPAQAETERYLNHVADRYDLRSAFQFNTRVTAAHWDQPQRCWVVGTERGETLGCRFLLMCGGGLSVPLHPPFAGHERFKGQVLHTSRWPEAGVHYAGKRVGVVGTGATGIQVIQTIAAEVAHLTVFQRTPNYAIPMRNPRFDDATRAAWRERYPMLKQRVQQTFAGFDYDFDSREFFDIEPAERHELLETLWQDGSLNLWIGGFSGVFFDEKVNAEVSAFVREKIRARIRDPRIAAKLVPTDHGFGTRRVPLETGYFDVYNRDNVSLVDLRETPIECLTERGVQTAAGEIPLDLLILATGFDAGTGALTGVDIRGREGLSLKEDWASRGIHTTMGLQVHGYPNLFMTMGPFSPAAAFCNVPTCVQQQVDWIGDCIGFLRRRGDSTIEPGAEIEAKWIAQHEELAKATLVYKTKSWYMGSNVEGKERRMLPFVGGAPVYRAACEEVKTSGYAGFVTG